MGRESNTDDELSARQIEAQLTIRKLRGNVEWEGDLESSRLSRTFDVPVEDKDRPFKKTERWAP